MGGWRVRQPLSFMGQENERSERYSAYSKTRTDSVRCFFPDRICSAGIFALGIKPFGKKVKTFFRKLASGLQLVFLEC